MTYSQGFTLGVALLLWGCTQDTFDRLRTRTPVVAARERGLRQICTSETPWDGTHKGAPVVVGFLNYGVWNGMDSLNYARPRVKSLSEEPVQRIYAYDKTFTTMFPNREPATGFDRRVMGTAEAVKADMRRLVDANIGFVYFTPYAGGISRLDTSDCGRYADPEACRQMTTEFGTTNADLAAYMELDEPKPLFAIQGVWSCEPPSDRYPTEDDVLPLLETSVDCNALAIGKGREECLLTVMQREFDQCANDMLYYARMLRDPSYLKKEDGTPIVLMLGGSNTELDEGKRFTLETVTGGPSCDPQALTGGRKWLREAVPCLPPDERLPAPLVIANNNYTSFDVGHTNIERLIEWNLSKARLADDAEVVHGFSLAVDPRPRFNVEHLGGKPIYAGFSDEPTYLEVKEVIDAMLTPLSCPQDRPGLINPSVNLGTSKAPVYLAVAGPMDELDESHTILPLKRDYGYGAYTNDRYLSVFASKLREGGWCAGCFVDTWSNYNNDHTKWSFHGAWSYMSAAPFLDAADYPLLPHSPSYPYPTPHGFPIQFNGPIASFDFYGADESTSAAPIAWASIDVGTDVQTVTLHAARLPGRGTITLYCEQFDPDQGGASTFVASHATPLGAAPLLRPGATPEVVAACDFVAADRAHPKRIWVGRHQARGMPEGPIGFDRIGVRVNRADW